MVALWGEKHFKSHAQNWIFVPFNSGVLFKISTHPFYTSLFGSLVNVHCQNYRPQKNGKESRLKTCLRKTGKNRLSLARKGFKNRENIKRKWKVSGGNGKVGISVTNNGIEKFRLNFSNRSTVTALLRPWQTRTHCCQHKCFPVCPRAQHLLRTQILCPGQQRCFWFCSETFCVRKKCFPVCAAQETSWATMCPQHVSSFTRALKNSEFITNFLFTVYYTSLTIC